MPQEGYPNLIGAGDKTPEELREQTAKAGRASGVSRRKRKTFRESLLQILAMAPDDPEVIEKLRALGLDPTRQTLVDLAQVSKAEKGDTDAARFVRDTIGEKPREELEIGGLVDRPIHTIDMTALSDDQLRALAEARADA